MTPGGICRQGHSGIPTRLATITFICFLLGACATLSQPSPVAVERAGRAEQLYRNGELEQAAAEFLELARTHSGDAEAYYRLRAAEALRDHGDIEAAADALGDIKRRRLHEDEPQRLDLLDAEIAISRGDTERAKALLAFDDATLPSSLRVRALELRARAELASGDAFSAARMRAALDRSLDAGDREDNRKQLIATLSTLDTQLLRERFDTLPDGDALRPWIEQVLRGKGQPLARALPRPSRPVGTMQPGSDGAMQAEGYDPPRHVALLLPVSALPSVSAPIRDGFLAAYFADDPERRPDVRVYDAGKTPADAIRAYDAAVADGADRVIGPLQREAVGELFHRALPARVLALNHPDTGEVPPPGSAEFGLLPDAEGAQAAEHMHELGITHAAMIVADADWAARAGRAFRAQFEAAGNRIVGEARLPDKEVDFADAISRATATLGSEPGGGIFISMRPQQARLLMAQLRAINVGARVFATSHIYAGDSNASLDRDLDGVEFCDAAWLFRPIAGRPQRERLSRDIGSANGFGGRLFAFGMDAYALLPYLDWLLSHPDAYLDGATGELTADSFGRIHRLVSWARFENGIALPIDGALRPLPMQ